MKAIFFDTPMPGSFVRDRHAAGSEGPFRKCLVLAFDNHSEHYLVADWENGQQHWLGVDDIQIDCDKLYDLNGGGSQDEGKKGEPCPYCKQIIPEEEDD